MPRNKQLSLLFNIKRAAAAVACRFIHEQQNLTGAYLLIQRKAYPIKRMLLPAAWCFISLFSFSQDINNTINAGNEAYKKNAYKEAADLYTEALADDKDNLVAKFNLANALYRQNKIAEASRYLTELSAMAAGDDMKAKVFYNKGLAMVRAQKLPDAIEAFKQSLLLAPADNDTRENLQKAISELKKQQQSQPNPQQNKQQKQNKRQQQNKMPDKNIMEQKFDELRDKEKQLQKLLQRRSNNEQPEKDW